MKYKLRDFVEAVSETEPSPQDSQFDRFVGLEHYDSGEIEITRYTDTSLLSSSVKIFHANDILIARRNVYLKRAGIVFFDGLTSGDSIILRVLKDCERNTEVPYQDALRWLPLVLNSSVFWAYANKHADGMNSKRISKEMLLDYEFNAPTITTIRSIANKVWSANSLKKNYRKLLGLTDEMVKSRFFSQFADLPFDHKWKDVLTIINGKAYGEEYKVSGTYPICGSGGIMGYGEKKMCDRDSIILGRKGNIDKPIYMSEDYWIVDTAFCLSPNTELIHPVYLYYWCKQFDFQKLNKQAVLPSLTRSDLEQIDIQVPEMAEQLAFVEIVHQADKSKFELKQAIEKIDKVMRALLQ